MKPHFRPAPRYFCDQRKIYQICLRAAALRNSGGIRAERPSQNSRRIFSQTRPFDFGGDSARYCDDAEPLAEIQNRQAACVAPERRMGHNADISLRWSGGGASVAESWKIWIMENDLVLDGYGCVP
ncbi:MAG: hypothetical protein J2P21_12390 [Chloracidobacterium sp.]|nr:hypothetical protein [Chloracidobacterium sp.]